jgi:hypothetical protein
MKVLSGSRSWLNVELAAVLLRYSLSSLITLLAELEIFPSCRVGNLLALSAQCSRKW